MYTDEDCFAWVEDTLALDTVADTVHDEITPTSSLHKDYPQRESGPTITPNQAPKKQNRYDVLPTPVEPSKNNNSNVSMEQIMMEKE